MREIKIKQRTFKFLIFAVVLGAFGDVMTIKFINEWIHTFSKDQLIGGVCVIGICVIGSLFIAMLSQRKKDDWRELKGEKNSW